MDPFVAVIELVRLFDPDCGNPYEYIGGHRDLVKVVCTKLVEAATGGGPCPFCGFDEDHAGDCLVLRARQKLIKRGKWVNPRAPGRKVSNA